MCLSNSCIFTIGLKINFTPQYKTFRSDGGGEYTSHQFLSYLSSQGIQAQRSCPYTPEQNGIAERKHRHLIDTTRTLLHQAHLPYHFWADALQTALYLINRLPTKNLEMQSPYQRLYQQSPTYAHLRTFGCACYLWQKPLTTHKLQPRAPLCIFLGYSDISKGYRCFEPLTRKIITSRHVVFNESIFPMASSQTSTTPPPPPPPNLLIPASTHPKSTSAPSQPTSSPEPASSTSTNISSPEPPPPQPETPLHHSAPAPPPIHHSSSPIPLDATLPPPQPTRTHPMVTRLQAGIPKPTHKLSLTAFIQLEIAPTTYLQAASASH